MATNLIEVEMNSPFQNQPVEKTGLTGKDLSNVVGDPFDFGEKVGNAQAEKAFASLLDQGKEGMVQTVNALLSEGSLNKDDMLGLDPNNPAFQSADGQLKWYEGVTSKLKKNADKKSRMETSSLIKEGKDVEAVTNQFESGLVDFESTSNFIQNVKSREELQKFLKEREESGLSGKSTISMLDDDLLNENDSLEDENSKMSVLKSTLTGEAAKNMQSLIDTNNKKIANNNKELQRRGVEVRSIRSQAGAETRSIRSDDRSKNESDLKAKEKFAKETQDYRARNVELGELDKTLKELGQESGLDMSASGDFDLPGAGTLGQKFSRFEAGKRGKLVILIENVFAKERHDLFGATLTGNELDSFNKLRGAKFLGNEEQMLESLKNVRRSLKEKLKPSTTRQAEVLNTLEGGGADIKPTLSEDDEFVIEEKIINGVKIRRKKRKK